MSPFLYRRAVSIEDACRLAAEDGAMALAGGQTLLRDMKLGMHAPAWLIDINGVLSRDIEPSDGVLKIGAGATHAEVAASPVVLHHLPALAALAGHIGDPAVRNRGTLGGAVAANEPHGDYPAACLALDAVIHTTTRDIGASAFFASDQGARMERGEIVTAVTFSTASRAAYVKFLNPAARYAIVGAFVSVLRDGEPRVAITGARVSGAFRWKEAERAAGKTLAAPDMLSDIQLPLGDLRVDLFADALYRAHLANVLARRAAGMAASGSRHLMVLAQGARPMLEPTRREV